ncbi:MAG: hypothetical protein R3261_09415 [Alphaproteobacteria bacterium]|nr:hypothetical protein [Alphaproteobacteria bacterium]
MSESFESDVMDENFEIKPSEVDELTHRELLMLYEESANSIRFQKMSQWRTFYGGILLMIGLIVFGEYSIRRLTGWVPGIIVGTTILNVLFIYVIFVYHLLQNLERKKIKEIALHLSNLSVAIREIKSPFETAFHRYTLLFVMISVMIGMCGISILLMSRYIPK